MSGRTTGQRIDRAVEMIRVFQDTHHNPGSTHRTLPDPTPEEVSDVLTLVLVELLAGAQVTPGSHGPRCWRLPGHHRCAIEKLQGAEGAAKLGVVDEGEIEAAQGSLEL